MWLSGPKSSGSQNLEDPQDTQLLNMYIGTFFPPVKDGRWEASSGSQMEGALSYNSEIGFVHVNTP